MKYRPILFSAPMVRALLNGRKTQTRRIVKPQPTEAMWDIARANLGGDTYKASPAVSPTLGIVGLQIERDGMLPMGFIEPNIRCPYGRPGERLWVRETWCRLCDPETLEGKTYYRATEPLHDMEITDGDGFTEYRKDGTPVIPWKPSIHMRREYSRITLEITYIRVERLNGISVPDAMAEGCDGSSNSMRSPYTEYAALWAKINGTEGPRSWDANPWVWVVGFRVVKP